MVPVWQALSDRAIGTKEALDGFGYVTTGVSVRVIGTVDRRMPHRSKKACS
jgi:hypothetical protein